MGVGLLRGRVVLGFMVSRFSFLVSKFLGFLVSKFLGFKVSKVHLMVVDRR